MKFFGVGFVALASLASFARAASVEITPQTIDKIKTGTW
jgi:hypothetical protein